ncbi:hypothetical protein AGMMS49975_03780 [Clostridia bacterium]|nr:hypothetical protein AGMMS49975_03780 [Clostridia bacterium]
MNNTQIITPDNITLEYRIAGAGSRIAAAFIDFAVQTLLILIIIIAAFYIFFYGDIRNITASDYSMNKLSWVSSVLLLLVFIIQYFYFILTELLLNGQTLGKKILGLRAIRDNGAPLSLKHSMIRNILRLVIDNAAIGLILIIVNKKSKRIGDMAAGTIVIAQNSKRVTLSADDFAVSRQAIAEESNFEIDQREYYILKDYFARRYEFLDGGERALAHLRIYFAEKFDEPKETFSDFELGKMMQSFER